MKLLTRTLLYASAALIPILGIWASVFYFSARDEIYASLDDELDNHRNLIIRKAKTDSTILVNSEFDERHYLVRRISKKKAAQVLESYSDTMMYMESEHEMEPVRVLSTVFALNKRFYALKVIAPMVKQDDQQRTLLLHTFYLYIAIILSVGIINSFFFRKVWKPFYQLVDQLRTFSLNNNNPVAMPSTNITEFIILKRAIATLISRNAEIYNSQKQFIENVSHELQTPLAISINRLELMLEEETQSESRAHTIADIIGSLERLSRLNASLLLLSKIENKQWVGDEPISFNSVIKKQLEEFMEQLSFKRITPHIKEQAVFECFMNKDLAFILIGNILKNAIVHNIINGEIEVAMTTTQLKVINTGKKTALDEKNIFKRFFKMSDKKSNTGLGLAISKAICDRYRLQLTYTFDQRHIISIHK